ncbi:MAG TPA: hypothetical protein VHZ74_26540 [Bryobacteraceae bacterium]|nr:hypothetical protein [Bryobacteraceae bacterium]
MIARIVSISLLMSAAAGWVSAQAPAAPTLLFRMALENTTRHPLTQEIFTNPDLEVQSYGDGKNMLVAIGKAETDPHLFDGLCERPCGFTLHDKNHDFDLTGRAKIKWTTIVSGFHRARPLIKLMDGTLLIGDQGDGSMADWQSSEVSFADLRWLKLDPARGVTISRTWEKADLSKVSEVGFFDVIPGSGTPPGGWVAIAAFELWGKPVVREVAH